MSTYRELTDMVLDELKMISDDNHFQREHVMFLLDKYRSFVIKQRYSDIKKEIPESNYQTICVDLELVSSYGNSICHGEKYLKSIQKIPELMTVTQAKISTMDFFQSSISYVGRERFKYAGSGKYSMNTIYGTLAPDEHLYLKSNNPQAYYLKKVKVTGVFEDSAKASELSCDGEDNNECDVLDRNFPMEEALVPVVLEFVLKELGGAKYHAADEQNNASDDLDKLANFIARNLKKRYNNYEDDKDSSTASK